MNTETRRASSRAYHAKREAEGLKKVTLWLSPAARFKLDALKKSAGSKDKAANDAILAWSGPGSPETPQPVRRKPKPISAKPAPVSRKANTTQAQADAAVKVQLGPVRPKYGERQKGSKK